VREAQQKVNLDLNSAHQIYQQKLKYIEGTLAFTAMRRFSIKEALQKGNRQLLLGSLREAMKKGQLDIITITDKRGKVVLRVRNPEVFGDSQAQDEMVSKVLRDKKSVYGTQIIPREKLFKESEELAERARMKFIPTPMAKPTSETENTSGMILKAAVPIFDEANELIGVLYGGILLNRRYDIVDEIKNVVYRGVKYEGKDIGTATIFQKDLRISTNVQLNDGERAIGTRVSSEVYDRVIGEGKLWTTRAFVVNDWYLTAYEPIRNIDGKVIGILYVGILEKKYNDMKAAAFWDFFWVAVAGMVLALAIAYVLARAIAKPIQQLERGVEAIAKGNFGVKVDIKSSDEIGTLAESFNRVSQELKGTYEKLQGKIEAADEDLKKAYKELQEKQEQLVQAAKLGSLGELAAGVAHEINNPLGTITLYAQMIRDELKEDQEETREEAEVILRHATRAAEIVKNLLEFARRTDLEARPVSVNTALEEALSVTAHQAELQQVNVVRQLSQDVPLIVGDVSKLQQVFVNIVVNALQVMQDGGRLIIKSSATSDGGLVQVSITDTGPGIPEESLQKIFEPFFTTKGTGKGTGLGLSVSHGIIEQHKGNIEVSTKVGEGTTFTITIPAADKEKL
jgi:two-component system NtrC family sensor kinase